MAIGLVIFHLQTLLVARTRLYKPLCWLVGWSVGLSVCQSIDWSVAEDSEHATYGNRPCLIG